MMLCASYKGDSALGCIPTLDTAKVSDANNPLVSVAVTSMVSPVAVFGTVPLKVSVDPLKCSQDGNATPFASVAV